MPIWTAESDRRLLLSVITALSPSPPKWETVVNLMGAGYTTESVRQRYMKIKKLASTELGDASGDGVTPTKATPRKRSAAKPKDGVNGGAHKKERDDDDDEVSPIKKMKVKDEVDSD